MKRIIPFLFSFFIFTSVTLAGDCFSDPIYERDWNAVITTGMRVRDVACMEGSTVLTTVPVGHVVHVIAETDGWYKVQTADGTVGWSGQWLLEPTNKPFNTVSPTTPAPTNEPLYDIVGNQFETAIRYLKEKNIIEGYSDGSYKPSKSVNRAEFTKIIVEAKLASNPVSSASNCFPDVKSSDWFAGYVCYAKNNGIIGGYPDGYFRPAETINLAEAAKILVNTLNVSKSSTESSVWYKVFIEALQNKSYIPNTFQSISQKVNRGEMAEMIWRIKENVYSQPFATFDIQEPSASDNSGALMSCADSNIPSSVDMEAVRTKWLQLYNNARAQQGLSAYSYNDYLNRSATVWSEYMNDTNTMSHKRPGQTNYYDYSIITKWFADLGLTFANNYGVTYSENIGYGTYRCSDSDCTQEMIDAIEPIFNAYMAERGTGYTAHYDSVMNKYFKIIGLGISVNTSKEVMYLTVHYGTELTSNPGSVCE
ncbi:S-layer homology domain-containing protein [Candidatus Peregrinibacteria bacterium]|nr:S-layer homology domain-containing protein [Candidatus Peregrinibacteria bacterium]